MLDNLLQCRNTPELILLHNETGLPNSALLFGFISQRTSPHVFLFENSPKQLNHGIKNSHDIKVFDFYTDPMGWGGVDRQSLNDTLMELINNEHAMNMTVIFDSVSEMLAQLKDSMSLYRILQILKTNVKQVILLLHNDQVQENILISLQHMADATVQVKTEYQEMKKVISALKYDEGSKSVLICNTVYRKKNGKVSVSKEKITFNKGLTISVKPWLPVLKTSVEPKEIKPDQSEKELTDDLTFNLSLSANEKAAKNKLVMPYTQSKLDVKFDDEEKGGRIFYEADDVDDFDEEDPDDDLEF